MAERALHIGVDGRELLGRPTGVGTYLREIVGAWTADPAWPHRLTLVVPARPPEELASRFPRVDWLLEPAPHAGTWWEQRRLPAALSRVAADVLFAPAYTGPLSAPCPMVLTIHDLSYVVHPEWFSWREGMRRRWLTRASARRAAVVLTDAEVVAAEIRDRLDIPRDRVQVVPLGAPAGRARSSTGRGPVVLYVGSMFERRHIPDLIEGFGRVATGHPTARLILVGEDRSRRGIDPLAIAASRGLASRVDWHPYLADGDLARLYARARVFAFLSAYEGFGMTPLEAMAHGVPPIVLDTPIAREVYADAACYVTPDAASIGVAIGRLLDDDVVHADLVTRGAHRLAAFSWTRTAAATQRAIEGALRLVR